MDIPLPSPYGVMYCCLFSSFLFSTGGVNYFYTIKLSRTLSPVARYIQKLLLSYEIEKYYEA